MPSRYETGLFIAEPLEKLGDLHMESDHQNNSRKWKNVSFNPTDVCNV